MKKEANGPFHEADSSEHGQVVAVSTLGTPTVTLDIAGRPGAVTFLTTSELARALALRLGGDDVHVRTVERLTAAGIVVDARITEFDQAWVRRPFFEVLPELGLRWDPDDVKSGDESAEPAA